MIIVLFAHREAQHFAGSVIRLSYRFSQGTDAQNALTFSHRNRFTRVEQVEAMGRFQDALVSRQCQWLFERQQGGLRFFLVLFETGEQEIDVGVFKVIRRLFPSF